MSENREYTPVLSGAGESNITFVKPSQLTGGEKFEGKFIEALPNNFDETKNDYKLIDDSGNTIILNSCASLNNQMGRVTPGSYVLVEYSGKIVLEKGKMAGKEAHNFIVSVA